MKCSKCGHDMEWHGREGCYHVSGKGKYCTCSNSAQHKHDDVLIYNVRGTWWLVGNRAETRVTVCPSCGEALDSGLSQF